MKIIPFHFFDKNTRKAENLPGICLFRMAIKTMFIPLLIQQELCCELVCYKHICILPC